MQSPPTIRLSRAPVTAYSYGLPKPGMPLQVIGVIQGGATHTFAMQGNRALTLNVADAFTFARGGAMKSIMDALAKRQIEATLLATMSKDESTSAVVSGLAFGRATSPNDGTLTLSGPARLIEDVPFVDMRTGTLQLFAHRDYFGRASLEVNQVMRIAAEARYPAAFTGLAKDGTLHVTSMSINLPTSK